MSSAKERPQRWVCLDVGETLIDETRVWSIWADELRIPRLTFMAAFGAIVARRQEHQEVFDLVGQPDWRAHLPQVMESYGPFRPDDLYPDVLVALDSLSKQGYRLALVANQPARRSAELRALGVHADLIAMSEELGVQKPDPSFFQAALRVMGDPNPADVCYVGDRPDNDVRPSATAGMRAIWIRRGPWGFIWQDAPEAALVVKSLAELAERIDEAWATQADGEVASTRASR